MKVYLAGPMQGYENFNKKNFDKYEEILKSSGYEVFNPSETDLSKSYQSGEVEGQEFVNQCLNIDLNYICKNAEAIALMPGWENSKGAKAEYFTALACNLKIIILEDALNGLEGESYIGLKSTQKLANKTAVEAGWYKDLKTGKIIERNFGEVVALMHSELSEALEADRKSLKDDKLPNRDGREVEFADCIIRIFDTSEALNLDVAGALIEKNRFNSNREDHKISNRNDNGKKY